MEHMIYHEGQPYSIVALTQKHFSSDKCPSAINLEGFFLAPGGISLSFFCIFRKVYN